MVPKAAQLTDVVLSVGLKCVGASPPNLRSCIRTVGGEVEADSNKSPLLEAARTFGVNGCVCAGGRRLLVGSE